MVTPKCSESSYAGPWIVGLSASHITSILKARLLRTDKQFLSAAVESKALGGPHHASTTSTSSLSSARLRAQARDRAATVRLTSESSQNAFNPLFAVRNRRIKTGNRRTRGTRGP